MLNQTNLDLLGWILLLTGTVILAIFRLNIGDQWLQNRARGVREKLFGPELNESKELLIQGLGILARHRFQSIDFIRDRTLDSGSSAARSRRKEGILKPSDEEFDEVIKYLKEKHRSNSGPVSTTFEPISSNDDVMRLERVKAGHEGVIDVERGVQPGFGEHIHAVMEDGSRKIVLDPSYASMLGRSIAKKEQEEERKRRRRIENRIEDLVRAVALIMVIIGFVLMDPPLEVLKGMVMG